MTKVPNICFSSGPMIKRRHSFHHVEDFQKRQCSTVQRPVGEIKRVKDDLDLHNDLKRNPLSITEVDVRFFKKNVPKTHHRSVQRTNAIAAQGNHLFDAVFDIKNCNGGYGGYKGTRRVTLKPQHKCLTLKKAMQICQHFVSSAKGQEIDRFKIAIKIFNQDRGFVIRRQNSGSNQIMIETLNSKYVGCYPKSQFKDGYDEMVSILDTPVKDKNSAYYATLLLNELDSSVENSAVTFKTPEKSKELQAMVFFIAVTHIAEACPGRTPGMDKLARASLHRIKSGDSIFSDEFNTTNGRYFVAQKNGGANLGRESMLNSRPPDPTRDSSEYMSDTSDEEGYL